MKVLVIINENHKLFPQQSNLLNAKYKNWGYLKAPTTGWSLLEMKDIITSHKNTHFIFASPIAALMSLIVESISKVCGHHEVYPSIRMNVFHNDKRDAKEIELPDGKKKVIHAIAKEGWVIV